MSGTTFDDDNRRFDAPPIPVSPEFEADVQCAVTNSSPVLITAPPDLAAAVARRIHGSGLNRRSPFLTLDCSRAQQAEQLEMVFEIAAPKGTVFLRDVDRLAPPLQALLNTRMAAHGVRVIAATSVSLLRAAALGTFDERLFYRLNQIHLIAPQPGKTTGTA